MSELGLVAWRIYLANRMFITWDSVRFVPNVHTAPHGGISRSTVKATSEVREPQPPNPPGSEAVVKNSFRVYRFYEHDDRPDERVKASPRHSSSARAAESRVLKSA